MKVIYKLFFIIILFAVCTSCDKKRDLVAEPLAKHVLEQAEKDLALHPATITSFIAERSAGTLHDFYSEGDYWWPDSLNPGGPYIRRDGETNPDNFVEHRHVMIRFSKIVGNLTSAYLLTGDDKFVESLIRHVRAWFIDEKTRMNPHMLYAQAIKGVVTGRGIGIIDTIHLIEVVQSLIRLEEKGVLSKEDLDGTKAWFSEYLKWISTHEYGLKEMNAENNHGTCWAVQAAIFAKYIGDTTMINTCIKRFKEIFLVEQMAENGSFPRELSRTKPYGYSLFNLDAMVTLCQILSTHEDNLWDYTTPDGKNIKKSIDFMFQFIQNKSSWPYQKDVMYWEEWPVAQPALIFAWYYYNEEAYYRTWRNLEHFPSNNEVIRNLPVRNPIIWLY